MVESKSGTAPGHPDAIRFNFRRVASAGQGEGDDPGGLGLNGGLHLAHNVRVVVGQVGGLIGVRGEVEESLICSCYQ